jgi:hypothetical protein
MAKKEITYQGLVDLNVQVEDISLSSPNYFRVAKLPSEFTAGKNVFRFKGNASLFAEGAPIYIEILDANGDPIYYETSLDLESAEQAAIVTVYINEDTAPGVAIIAICSTANYDIDGKILDTTQINVRWTNQIYIDVSKRNEAEIIFDALPEVTVFPSTGSYIVKTYFGNNKVAQLAFSSSKYYYRNDTPIVTGYIGNISIGTGVAANYIIDPNSLEAATITFPISSLQNATPAALNTITTTQFTSSIDSFIYNTDILWFSLDQMYGDTWDPLTAKLLITYPAIPVNKTASDYLSVGQEVQLAIDTFYDYEIITARIVSINNNEITLDNTTSITGSLYQGTLLPSIGIKLAQPLTVDQTNGIEHIYSNASFSTNPIFTFEQLPNASASTQNTNNLVTVYFNNLEPQTGTVSKIRSYYRSAGIGEYILSNETDISGQETEFGFNTNIVTASFFLPTTQRNDKLDFKFEFINPAGFVSKQVVESVNNTFLGGNTYIGGDDNLLTGSLYVAGSTGTGVHISGKGKSAMIRSIGYTGFQNAIAPGGTGGFVMYSGSVQPILGSAESYSGVGLELVANSNSYFKYTTSGSGMLDVRTNAFFLGNTTGTFISGSNGNLQISASNFSILNGNVTASNMVLQNISYADFFANKQIVITNENSESFYRYTIPGAAPAYAYGKAYCILDLSGVQGPFASGSAAMYVRFYVNPRLPIAAIISPADSGYDGQIIIETYGPAYSPAVTGTTCGDFATFGSNVLLQSDIISEGSYYNSGSINFYRNIGINSTYYLFPSIGFDKYWEATGSITYSDYFTNTTSITAPAGLPTVNTLGKKRSLRSRITFETDDWACKSYNQTRVNPANALASCGTPYQNMLQCAPGGRYAFAPGDSGWRLQSVTNYSGSVAPVYPNGAILYSPNKTAYKIIVSNAGTLSTVAV